MKVSLDLHVFNWLLGVEINEDSIPVYERAVSLAFERYHIYYNYYKDRKTEHQIALMTMIDLCLQPLFDFWSDFEEKEPIEFIICDEKLTVTVNKNKRQLFQDAAKYITERYSWYYKTYEKAKSEMDISKMVLVDVCIEKFKF